MRGLFTAALFCVTVVTGCATSRYCDDCCGSGCTGYTHAVPYEGGGHAAPAVAPTPDAPPSDLPMGEDYDDPAEGGGGAPAELPAPAAGAPAVPAE